MPAAIRSVVGTIDLPADDPDLAGADAYVRALFDRSLGAADAGAGTAAGAEGEAAWLTSTPPSPTPTRCSITRRAAPASDGRPPRISIAPRTAARSSTCRRPSCGRSRCSRAAAAINLRRAPRDFFADLFTNPAYQPYDLTPAQIFDADDLRFNRDPFDALICAAARDLRLPLITRDADIGGSGACRVIW